MTFGCTSCMSWLLLDALRPALRCHLLQLPVNPIFRCRHQWQHLFCHWVYWLSGVFVSLDRSPGQLFQDAIPIQLGDGCKHCNQGCVGCAQVCAQFFAVGLEAG